MEWKPVVGYENIYEVRQGIDGGKVRRIAPIKRSFVGRKLGGKSHSQGYHRVVLSKPGEKPKLRYLHHIVLEAFVGPRPKGMEACHKNDNKSHNVTPNLYWGKRSNNLKDAWRNGIFKNKKYLRGDDHPNAKLSIKDRSAISNLRREGVSVKELAIKFMVTEKTIYLWIKKGGELHGSGTGNKDPAGRV